MLCPLARTANTCKHASVSIFNFEMAEALHIFCCRAFAFLALAGASLPSSTDLGATLAWELSSAGGDDPHGAISVPSRVPGDVNADLVAAHILPDYWVGTNALELPWFVPRRQWTYSAAFPTPSDASEGSGSELRFEGCDYNCTFFLNDVRLGHHFGSFSPAVYDVSSLLERRQPGGRAGNLNRISVQIHPPPAKLIAPLYNGSSQMYGVDQCLENQIWPMWKSRLNRWDFAPKTWQIGLWRTVLLRTHGPRATLRPAPVVLPRLRPPYDTAALEIRAAVRLAPGTAASSLGELLPGGFHPPGGGGALKALWQVVCLTDASAPGLNVTTNLDGLGRAGSDGWLPLTVNLTLPKPRLWHPNGYGEQHRYRLTLTVVFVPHPPLDSLLASPSPPSSRSSSPPPSYEDQVATTFGVRDLQILKNPGPKSHPGWWTYNQASSSSYEHGSMMIRRVKRVRVCRALPKSALPLLESVLSSCSDMSPLHFSLFLLPLLDTPPPPSPPPPLPLNAHSTTPVAVRAPSTRRTTRPSLRPARDTRTSKSGSSRSMAGACLHGAATGCPETCSLGRWSRIGPGSVPWWRWRGSRATRSCGSGAEASWRTSSFTSSATNSAS